MSRLPAKTLLCLGLAVMAGTAHAQTKLSYGSYLPPTHVNNTVGIEPMIKRLEQESGGKLTVEFFPGGSVAKATAAVDSIRDGIVTAGMIVDTYVPKQLPHSFLITELGLLGRNSVGNSSTVPSTSPIVSPTIGPSARPGIASAPTIVPTIGTHSSTNPRFSRP